MRKRVLGILVGVAFVTVCGVGIVVTFLAMLELAKEHLVEIMQSEPLAPIYVKSLATAS